MNIYSFFVVVSGFNFKIISFYFLHLWGQGQAHARAQVWKSGYNLGKLVLPSITMWVLGSELRLGSKCLCSLSHLTSP